MSLFSRKEENRAILAVTFGTILEWYEIYLYIYWAPVISRLFFGFQSSSANLIGTLTLFAIGFLARPLGGLFFGRIGDRLGRKKSLLLSITLMTFPTFLMGLLPTYEQIGIFSPILLGCLRLMQSFPAGGESPGAFCYLYESASPKRRRYLSSWGAVGNQIGVVLSMMECLFLEQIFPQQILITWGWRLSFIMGGIIGLSGFYLRHKLHETPLYREIELRHSSNKEPVLNILHENWKKICIGISYCVLDGVGFYLISGLLPLYTVKAITGNPSSNLILSALVILVSTIPLPIFGLLGDRFDNRKMMIGSSIGIILLIYPIYWSITNEIYILLFCLLVSSIIFFGCITGLIPYLLADLFPTSVRFTCLGFSFNIVDGVLGGFTPAIILYLDQLSHSSTPHYWILLFSALISLISYYFMRTKHPNLDNTKDEAD